MAAGPGCTCTVLAHTDLLVQELCGLVGRMTKSLSTAMTWSSGSSSRSREIPLNAQASSAIYENLFYYTQRGYSVAPAAPVMSSRTRALYQSRDYQQMLQSCLTLSA